MSFLNIPKEIRKSRFATKVALLLSLGLALTLPAQATEVSVKGLVYSTTNCNYASTFDAKLAVRYENKELPSGAQMIVQYKFDGNFGGEDMKYLRVQSLKTAGDYVWEAQLPTTEVASRGGYAFDRMEFSFKIIGEDGETQSNTYIATFRPGEIACSSDGALKELPVAIK
ncbi:MAG: hypothetical protein JNM39_12785 [Bdellovibrionaceae bacterium]|nr:hypothetical protein [Pseudobdellovibrionaceae bacterium]